MEYNYEPLLDPENEFFKARKDLEKKIKHKSLMLNEDLNTITSNRDFSEWLEKPLFDLEKILINELEKLTKNKTYFFGCSFEIYKLNYDERLQSYFKIYYDATEQDFIENEFNKTFNRFFQLEVNRYDLKQKFEYSIICHHTLTEQIMFSIIARNKFLKDKLDENLIKESNLFWNGTPTEFIELTKALIENGSLKGGTKGTQKEIIEDFSKTLNIEIKNPDKLLTDIKKRNIESETLFLDKLKRNLLNYINKENK